MAGRALQLRCKAKNGQHYLTGLTLTSSVGRLKEMLADVTSIPKDCLKVRQGYPPKVIDLSHDEMSLSSLPFRSGDTLIVEEDPSLRIQRRQKWDTELQDQIQHSRGMLMRKVVPANNSCLFTSINAVMTDGSIDLSCSQPMRELIAGVVLSDPDTYSQAFLGKNNTDYCNWIMNSESWGGGIEISILCKYYGVEIDVVDTQTGRIDRFGEDQNYSRRAFLIYDGIHYDPLILEPLAPGENIQTLFSSRDENVLSQAMEIASEAKTARQFTDTQNFSLRCLVCHKALVGQAEAQQHAKETSHVNFGEY